MLMNLGDSTFLKQGTKITSIKGKKNKTHCFSLKLRTFLYQQES